MISGSICRQGLGGRRAERTGGLYHVEGYDMFKRDLASLVPLHKDPVDDLGAATRRQPENKGPADRGRKILDTAYMDNTTSQNVFTSLLGCKNMTRNSTGTT